MIRWRSPPGPHAGSSPRSAPSADRSPRDDESLLIGIWPPRAPWRSDSLDSRSIRPPSGMPTRPSAACTTTVPAGGGAAVVGRGGGRVAAPAACSACPSAGHAANDTARPTRHAGAVRPIGDAGDGTRARRCALISPPVSLSNLRAGWVQHAGRVSGLGEGRCRRRGNRAGGAARAARSRATHFPQPSRAPLWPPDRL